MPGHSRHGQAERLRPVFLPLSAAEFKGERLVLGRPGAEQLFGEAPGRSLGQVRSEGPGCYSPGRAGKLVANS